MKKISWHELKPQVKEVWVLSLPAIFNADHNHRDAVYRFRHGGFARRERFGGDRSGIHEHMAAGRHYIRRFGGLFRAGGA